MLYQIRNLDTGDMIDMRETNKANFIDRMTAVTSSDRQSIEPFIRDLSKKNEALWLAAEMNQVQEIMDLLDKEEQRGTASEINSKGLDGMTALHLAAVKDNVEALDTLINYGKKIDIEARTNIQRTPLHLACFYGNLMCAKVLINYGANMHA
jgi:ankyrin repeat protein